METDYRSLVDALLNQVSQARSAYSNPLMAAGKAAMQLPAMAQALYGQAKSGFTAPHDAYQRGMGRDEAVTRGMDLAMTAPLAGLAVKPVAGGVGAGVRGKLSYQQILESQRAVEGLTAAMRDPVTGKVYKGSSHQAAIDTVPKGEGDVWGRLHSEWDQATDNSGFVDRRGKFITRTEAENQWGTSTMEDVRDLRSGRKGRQLGGSDDTLSANPKSAAAPAVVSAVGKTADGKLPAWGAADEAKRLAAHDLRNIPLQKAAVEHFGRTFDPAEAGYILPDGKMLDLSGRHYSTGYVKDTSGRSPRYKPDPSQSDQRDWLRGQRNVDHRELGDLLPSSGAAGYNDEMNAFVSQARAIRYSEYGIESSFVPTQSQIGRVVEHHNQINRGEPLTVDFTHPITGEVVASEAIERPTVPKVLSWFRSVGKDSSLYVNHPAGSLVGILSQALGGGGDNQSQRPAPMSSLADVLSQSLGR